MIERLQDVKHLTFVHLKDVQLQYLHLRSFALLYKFIIFAALLGTRDNI